MNEDLHQQFYQHLLERHSAPVEAEIETISEIIAAFLQMHADYSAALDRLQQTRYELELLRQENHDLARALARLRQQGGSCS